MNKKKRFRVFVIVFGRFAYIGKTTGCRISAVYNRHRRGEAKATKQYAREMKPVLYILRDGEMYQHEAYRLIVAYVHVLKNAGYTILNCTQTVERSADLHNETQELVREIEQESVAHLLERTLVAKPTDADDKNKDFKNVPGKEQADCKITIRATKAEKDRFDRIAMEKGMTQRQTLQYLISDTEEDQSDTSGDLEQTACRKKIEKLEKTNKELLESLRQTRENANQKIAIRDKRIAALRNGIAVFYKMMNTTNKMPISIGETRFKNCPYFHDYHYPEHEGAYVFRPTEIVWGKGRLPAMFILGIGDDGRKYKFRFYPKDYYAGVSIRNEKFARQTAVWLVGCEQTQSGAMDLVYAFPLEIDFKYRGSEEYGSEAKRYIADFMHEENEYNYTDSAATGTAMHGK